MSERALASIQVIDEIQPIEKADRIVLATILGWHVVIRKDEFQVGDRCVFVEIDSVLPERPEFEFMRERKFRVKTIKLRGVLSQGIAFPMSILSRDAYQYKVGDNVTDELGIKHYDEYHEEEMFAKSTADSVDPIRHFLFKHKLTRPLSKKLYTNSNGRERRGFPSFIHKTDETRVQDHPSVLKSNEQFIWTEKVDGCSATYYLRRRNGLAGFLGKYEFGVCSRNYGLPVRDNSHYWKVADMYHIENLLKDLLSKNSSAAWVCLQGEIVGPKIQGNPYKLNELRIYGFNLIYGEKGTGRTYRLNPRDGAVTFEEYDMRWVPILQTSHLPDTVDEMLAAAEGKSMIANVPREGVVCRSLNGQKSFKAVSNSYLLKYENREKEQDGTEQSGNAEEVKQ